MILRSRWISIQAFATLKFGWCMQFAENRNFLITSEMYDLFIKRTHLHIDLVRSNLEKMIGFGSVTHRELEARASRHDLSKFSVHERDGYILLTWRYHCKSHGIPFH